MTGLFASSLGHGFTNFIPTLYCIPNLKDRSPPTLRFCSQDYILHSAVSKRGSDYLASRSWNLCASLFIDTTTAPVDAKLCKDVDISRRSIHCHYVPSVYFEQTFSTYITVDSRVLLPTSHRQSLPCLNFTSIWGRARRRCTGIRGLFYIKELVYGKGPW